MLNDYLPHILMIIASFFWTTGYIYSNQNNVNQIEFLMMRGTMMVIISYIYCRYQGQTLDFKSVNLKKLIFRNLIGTFHGFYIAFCQFYLPLHVIHTLGSTGIIFVIILDYFIDSKKLTKQQICYISLSFLGVILIINHSWLTEILTGQKQIIQSQFQNYRHIQPITQFVITVILIFVLFFWALSIKISEKLGLYGGQLNYTYGITVVVTASIAYFFITNKSTPQIMYPGYLFSGTLLALSQLFFILAILKSKQAGLTLTMGNTCIVFAYFFSVFRYNQQVNMFCIFGSIITVIGVTKVMITK